MVRSVGNFFQYFFAGGAFEFIFVKLSFKSLTSFLSFETSSFISSHNLTSDLFCCMEMVINLFCSSNIFVSSLDLFHTCNVFYSEKLRMQS